jgi:hypothetical protein
VPTVLKSESLYLLEPSGPVKACNGIALPFTISTKQNPRTEGIKSDLQSKRAQEMKLEHFMLQSLYIAAGFLGSAIGQDQVRGPAVATSELGHLKGEKQAICVTAS